jgi:hypothetical protein
VRQSGAGTRRTRPSIRTQIGGSNAPLGVVGGGEGAPQRCSHSCHEARPQRTPANPLRSLQYARAQYSCPCAHEHTQARLYPQCTSAGNSHTDHGRARTSNATASAIRTRPSPRATSLAAACHRLQAPTGAGSAGSGRLGAHRGAEPPPATPDASWLLAFTSPPAATSAATTTTRPYCRAAQCAELPPSDRLAALGSAPSASSRATRKAGRPRPRPSARRPCATRGRGEAGVRRSPHCSPAPVLGVLHHCADGGRGPGEAGRCDRARRVRKRTSGRLTVRRTSAGRLPDVCRTSAGRPPDVRQDDPLE